MFNHTLWIVGKKEKKLLATPLSLLIPKLSPVSGTIIWETDLILNHYSNITGATAVGGYYLLCGLQGDADTQEREAGFLLCSAYLTKEGMKASSLFSLVSSLSLSIGVIPMGTSK